MKRIVLHLSFLTTVAVVVKQICFFKAAVESVSVYM